MSIVAANWKMNGSFSKNKMLLDGLSSAIQKSSHEVIIFPPFVYLEQINSLKEKFAIGAQDVSVYDNGAFTGAVSSEMLKDVGCEYVLVGHSERRSLFGESDAVVKEKLNKALADGLKVILCIGETLEERENNTWKDVLSKQLDVLDVSQYDNVIIAYEPVWAIGTGKSASNDNVKEVHEFIYCVLNKASGIMCPKILYGGSVNSSNIHGYLAIEYVDGVLVGGASLKVDEFSKILS